MEERLHHSPRRAQRRALWHTPREARTPMKKISTSLGKRGLDLLKLARTSFRLARTDEEAVVRNARRCEAVGRVDSAAAG